MANVTKPVLLDETGQSIVTALEGIANAVTPISVQQDIPITIQLSDWTQNVQTGKYQYRWENVYVTANCGVDVHFRNGSESIKSTYVEFDKVEGGGALIFSTGTLPAGNLPLMVTIIAAKASAVVDPIDASMVETDAIEGASNVDEALSVLDGEIGSTTLPTTAQTLSGAISENNQSIAKLSEGMTYVVNGNKSIESATIPVGSYVRLVNSSITGRSDGIYTVATAIPVDTVIDGTYFNENAPIAGGVANALNSNKASWGFDYSNPVTVVAMQTSTINDYEWTATENGMLVIVANGTPAGYSAEMWYGHGASNRRLIQATHAATEEWSISVNALVKKGEKYTLTTRGNMAYGCYALLYKPLE